MTRSSRGELIFPDSVRIPVGFLHLRLDGFISFVFSLSLELGLCTECREELLEGSDPGIGLTGFVTSYDGGDGAASGIATGILSFHLAHSDLGAVVSM